MNILFFDNPNLVEQNIPHILRSQNFSVTIAEDCETGRELISLYDYDAVLLALAAQTDCSVSCIKKIRAQNAQIPIIVVSDNTTGTTCLAALDAGADDYMTLPINGHEIAARLRVGIRRANGFTENIIRTGPIEIDLRRQHVHVGATRIHLTRKEFDILRILVLGNGAVISKTKLLDHLYGGDDEPDSKILDVFVCKLRRKICDAIDGTNPIETVWGTGYRLVAA